MDRNQSIAINAEPLTLRQLTGTIDEMTALQRVLEAAPAYFETVTGRPPGNAAAQSTFSALPPDNATLRLGVVERRMGARAFWRKLGYVETGEVKNDPAFASNVVVLEKALSRG